MTRPGQIDALTGIRGIASFWVLVHHAPNAWPLGERDLGWVQHLVEKGWLGVDLFFVLSGFVISYVYAEAMQRPSWPQTVRFWKLRLARIYPAHLVTTLAFVPLVFGAAILLGQEPPPDRYTPLRLLYALTLTNGFGIPGSEGWNLPSWSVSSEWFAYLCFPAATLVLGRRRPLLSNLLGAAAVLAAMVALAFALNGGTSFTLEWSWTLTRVGGEFCIGALLFGVYRDTRDGVGFDLLATGSAATILALSLAGVGPIWDWALVAGFGGLVLGCARAAGPVARLFARRRLVWLGEISYSIYLVHSLVIIVVGQLARRIWATATEVSTLQYVAVFAAYVALSLAAGHLLFHLVEQPARSWLRKRWAA